MLLPVVAAGLDELLLRLKLLLLAPALRLKLLLLRPRVEEPLETLNCCL